MTRSAKLVVLAHAHDRDVVPLAGDGVGPRSLPRRRRGRPERGQGAALGLDQYDGVVVPRILPWSSSSTPTTRPAARSKASSGDLPLAARMRFRDAGRGRGPGPRAGRGLDPAHGDRGGSAALDDPVRAAPGPARPRWPGSWPCNANAAFEEAVRPASKDARAGSPRLERKGPSTPSSSTRSTASTRRSRTRCCRRRGGDDRADRGDHREPVLRGQLGLLSRCASTSCTRSTTSTCSRCSRALDDRARHSQPPPSTTTRSTSWPRARRGDARTALSALELAGETVASDVTVRVAEDALQRSASSTTRAATSTTT